MAVNNINMGYLKIILGSMFAGKTTELVKEYKRHKSCGFKCLFINHKIDNRYVEEENKTSTHDRVIVDNMVEALGGAYIGARSYTLPTDKLVELTEAICSYNSNPKLNYNPKLILIRMLHVYVYIWYYRRLRLHVHVYIWCYRRL